MKKIHLILISILIISLYVLRKKVRPEIYPFIILMISISLLLLTSLRSWHISGWDIHQEYYTIQLTKSLGIWKFSNFLNAYNSCLSLTILPSILFVFLGLTTELLLKLIYPLIFSFTPVVLYLIYKKYPFHLRLYRFFLIF